MHQLPNTLRCLALALFCPTLLPCQTPPPQTRAAASEYRETSRLADVQAFVAQLASLPHGHWLHSETAGTSHEQRPLLLVHAKKPGASATRLRVLLLGNIHAGEVEGKEALQELLAEIAAGQHDDLLEHCELWVLPIYNVDGNEQMGLSNRPGQNGPAMVGVRANAQGFDLNRDFIKAEAPETRALLALFLRIDPHLFVDLHTTNGSYHGYHLTYAPCLSPNCDPGVATLSRELLDAATASMQAAHHFATFDYGNFETRDWDGAGAPASKPGTRGWYSYDSRPRYSTNYFGLRNRIAILSEAYSYSDFATRIAASKQFVLSLLHAATSKAEHCRAVLAAADAAPTQAATPLQFGFATDFAAPETMPVLVGEVATLRGESGLPPVHARLDQVRVETMPVFRSFTAREKLPLPSAWLVREPSAQVIALLQAHGVQFATLSTTTTLQAAQFTVSNQRRPKRPFQGHQELQLVGSWGQAQECTLLAGTLRITGKQPLARLAAQLLEPQSEDSLTTWNCFDAQIQTTHPVLRVP